MGIQWILEKEKKLWEDKEERPKSSRAMFGHSFVIGFLSFVLSEVLPASAPDSIDYGEAGKMRQ